MITSIEVFLVASFPNGMNVSHADFIAPLEVDDRPTTSDGGQWRTSTVELFSLLREQFATADEPSVAFDQEIRRQLIEVARWLELRSSKLLALVDELKVTLLIDMLIVQDQMDINLPSELMRICGCCDVSIQLITND